VILAFSANDNYRLGLGVTMLSASFAAAKKDTLIYFHLLCLADEAVGCRNFAERMQIPRVEIRLSRRISSVVNTQRKNIHVSSRHNLMHHLDFADLFPNLDRAIILDTDVLVTTDLFELDNECGPFANLNDCTSPSKQLCVSAGRTRFHYHAYYKCRAIKPKHNFFGVGIHISNLEAFRHCRRRQQMLNFLEDQTCGKKITGTKMLYNLIFDESMIANVSERWNTTPDLQQGENCISGIIHFSGLRKKPWDLSTTNVSNAATATCLHQWRTYARNVEVRLL